LARLGVGTLTETKTEFVKLHGYEYIRNFVDPSGVHEALFVGHLWKNPSLYPRYNVHKIEKTTFTKDVFYFFYRLGKEMYDSGIRKFDRTSTYSFLTSKPSEKNKKSLFDWYNDYGGYDVIEKLMSQCDPDKGNDEYHFSEVQKYESLRFFQREGLIDVQNAQLVNKLTRMNLTQLNQYMKHKFKAAFSQVNAGEVVEYYLGDNLDETIKELKQGEQVGIPLFDSPRLTRKINGQKLGNLNYLVLSSGVGKSSALLEKFVLSIYENNEKAIIFANEEGIKRWRSKLLVTVASRILKKPLSRDLVTKGGFGEDVEKVLCEAKEWIESHRKDNILFINLKKYRIQDVIDRIELYRAKGYKHIYFDTFKPEVTTNDDRWLAFSNSAQQLYDCIKEEANNCFCLATVQLKIGKEYRYLDLDCIGKSMEITEVAAVVMIGRLMFDDEYREEGSKYRLKPYNWKKDEFSQKWYKEPYQLDPEKRYIILFLAKNREGSEDEQIVFEVNYDFNVWKEVAYVQVPYNAR